MFLKILFLSTCVVFVSSEYPKWPQDFEYTDSDKLSLPDYDCIKLSFSRLGVHDHRLCTLKNDSLTSPEIELTLTDQVSGKNCNKLVLDGSDQYYLCMTESALTYYNFEWSAVDSIEGKLCIRAAEENYICATSTMRFPYWPSEFSFSYIGPKGGSYKCVLINEPEEPTLHFWYDNYMCVKEGKNIVDIKMEFSNSGSIPGRRCTFIKEGSDPDGWDNNYLCVSQKSPFFFKWTNTGLHTTDCPAGLMCVQWYEADPHTWYDNYLCHKKTTLRTWLGTQCSFAARSFNLAQVTTVIVLSMIVSYITTKVA